MGTYSRVVSFSTGGPPMANAPQDNRNRTRKKRKPSGSRSNSRGQRNVRRKDGTSPSSSGGSRRGTLTRPDTGYTLHSRRVRNESSGGFVKKLLQPRVLIVLAIGIIVVLVLIFGISSCVKKNNEAASQAVEDTKPKNEQDARVAAGVSAAMTSKFAEALDNAAYLAQIAEHANEYEDERLLTLALEEPAAVEFVANYPSSDKSSKPYTDTVKRGEVPTLYNWDKRWGAVTYGKGPLAVTGSGPTTLAMAYMGLTGKTDYSPAEIAQQASKSNYADGESGSKGELFSKLTTSMGLKAEQHEPAAETFLYSLNANTIFAVELKASTLTDEDHWALMVNISEDGTVTLFDPTSTQVSHTPWSVYTIASSSNTSYALSASDETLAELDKGNSTTNRTSATTTNVGAGATNSTTGTSNATTAEELGAYDSTYSDFGSVEEYGY